MMLRFDVGDGAGDGWDGNVEFFGHAFEGGRTRVQAVAEPDGDGVGNDAGARHRGDPPRAVQKALCKYPLHGG